MILASASPRRCALLAQLGIAFAVMPSSVPEVRQPAESPEEFAQRTAYEKAREVADRNPGAFVLAADTIVVADGEVFGKPVDRADARRMLTRLSGTTHQVFTAVALIAPAHNVEQFVVETVVEFRPLTDADIDQYLDSGESFDKAGAYAVQGGAAGFVTRITGSHSNVVGLPVDEIRALLDRRLGSA